MNDAVTGWPTYDRSATHVSVAGGMRPGVVIEEEPELTIGDYKGTKERIEDQSLKFKVRA
jgi:hypothetical protein